MTTIQLTRAAADDLMCVSPAFSVLIEPEQAPGLALLLRPVATDTILVDQKRWADILRLVFRDDLSGDYWALDYEHSHTETAEPWSYIEPELKKLKAVEKTVTVYELDTGS